jgi:hypothetical protein
MTDLWGTRKRVKMATLKFDAHIFAFTFSCLRLSSAFDGCFKMNELYTQKCVFGKFNKPSLLFQIWRFHFCEFEKHYGVTTYIFIFGGTGSLHLHFRRISKPSNHSAQTCFILVYLVYQLTLNTEAVFSSETSTNFYRNTELHMLVICKTPLVLSRQFLADSFRIKMHFSLILPKDCTRNSVKGTWEEILFYYT